MESTLAEDTELSRGMQQFAAAAETSVEASTDKNDVSTANTAGV
jgi:hypothetical protein